MDIIPQEQTQQPISDDQELAKALAGVMPDLPEPVVPETPVAPAPLPQPSAVPSSINPMEFEETPAPTSATPAVAPASTTPSLTPLSSEPNKELDGIKKDALTELRPLIDKVELPAEEKFDTYLMLIRSSDDPTLIAPAHAAAQGISDEKRRAEALLDIIKEIDYLSRGAQPTN